MDERERQCVQYVFDGMELLPGVLIPFVEERLEGKYGGGWQAKVAERWLQRKDTWHLPELKFDKDGKIAWDQLVLLRVMQLFWGHDFRTVLVVRGIGWAVINKLIKDRNKLAHNELFTCGEAERALDLMCRLTKAVGADETVAQLDAMRKAIPCIWGSVFKGFPFVDVYFDYSKGENVLRLAMDELRTRPKHISLLSEIGIDPRCPGRGDSRDDGGSVWDALVFKDADGWREFPHLTLGIGHEYVSAMVTLPSEASEALVRFKKLEDENFRRMMEGVLEGMRSVLQRCRGMEPRMRIRQRPAHSSARPLMDAHIDVDLRTYNADDASRFQPQWIDAAFGALRSQNSNPEVQVGARFPYQTCPEIAEANALDLVVSAWGACKPYIDVLFGVEEASAL